jgi:single-stranded-DNA-specific exonuclease
LTAVPPAAPALDRLLVARHVVPHTDADGLSAGAIALRARCEDADAAVVLRRGETPFGDGAPLPPGAVAVLDWGVRRLARPGLIVDHHAPEAEPGPDVLLVSGYGEQPPVSTSVLVWRIAAAAPRWLAALGAYGDLGAAGLRLAETAGVEAAAVRRLAPLVNAPRRLPDGSLVRDALALLVRAPDAAAALADPLIGGLADARAAVAAEQRRLMRVGPRVAGDVAVIRVTSPIQVHPLIATAWMRRLAPRLVVAANDGYLPGRVNFAVRGGTGDLRARLRAALPEGAGHEFAHGHDRASGGSLPPDLFALLLERLAPGQLG